MAVKKTTDLRKVSIKLPRAEKGDDPFVVVSVNGKTYQIQRGIDVEVPYEVAEVIYNSDIAKDAAISYIESQTSK